MHIGTGPTSLDDEDDNAEEGEAHKEGNGKAGQVKAALAAEDQCSDAHIQDGGGNCSQNWRHHPRQEDHCHPLQSSRICHFTDPEAGKDMKIPVLAARQPGLRLATLFA